ncbi:expressed unknown protein [Seminavis robusta]|uniref:Uncharacterized protein n=1 Tax=Seminavis robusta TaxID=568900 RepID=A0A9N8DZL2_9STRA|nr:expressed unknown protein [Seminavis robusta]|eukprot:Sro501_g155400.1 n/a (3206) ;mRNA; f:7843-17460
MKDSRWAYVEKEDEEMDDVDVTEEVTESEEPGIATVADSVEGRTMVDDDGDVPMLDDEATGGESGVHHDEGAGTGSGIPSDEQDDNGEVVCDNASWAKTRGEIPDGPKEGVKHGATLGGTSGEGDIDDDCGIRSASKGDNDDVKVLEADGRSATGGDDASRSGESKCNEENLNTDDAALLEANSDAESRSIGEFSFASSMEFDEEDAEAVIGAKLCPSGPFEMKLLRSCIEDGTSAIEELQGKDVVLVVGKTGVGKSLFIQGIAGKQIKPVAHVSTCYGTQVSSKVFEAVDPLPDFQIGHDKVSKTRSISSLVRQGAGKNGQEVVYVDSPGWDDTGGEEVDIATSVMFSRVVKQARSLRLVVLINYGSLLEDRGGAMRAVLKLAHTFVADFEKDKRSFMFLFTHTNEVEMAASLEESRLGLADEILRIRKDTQDKEVEEILKFMSTALKKQYGFVDVVHPLKTDFAQMSSFIETKLWTIRKPAAMPNCGLTVKSEMRLNAQVQLMLNTARRLLYQNKELQTPETVIQLKEIIDMFKYFNDHVCVGEIKKAYNECRELLQEHVNEQRLIMEDQLRRAKDENEHFGPGNIRLLKAAMSHLTAFTDDSNVTRSYHEKLIAEALSASFERVSIESALGSLGSTMKELRKMRAWSEGFPCCTDRYQQGRALIEAAVEDTRARVSLVGNAELETLDTEGLCSFARDVVLLSAIVRTGKELSLHKIDVSMCSKTSKGTEELLCTLAIKLGPPETTMPDSAPWKAAPGVIRELASYAMKLQSLQSVFGQQDDLVSSKVAATLGISLDQLESHTVKLYRALCTDFNANETVGTGGAEEKLGVLGSTKLLFSSLSPRWQDMPRLYNHEVAVMRSKLRVAATELERVAIQCKEHGFDDGQRDGGKYGALLSSVWFDAHDGNEGFVKATCDSVYNIYRCRMESMMDTLKSNSEQLKILSTDNVDRLNACHKAALEIKQFEKFESFAGNLKAVANGRKSALEGVRKYNLSLKDQSKELCAKWLAHVKELKDDDKARAMTEQLDSILGEIEAIDTFRCLPQMKVAAKEAKEDIMDAFATATSFAEKEFRMPLEYHKKADILGLINKLRGFRRTDAYLPSYSHFQEKARELVANDAVKVETLVHDCADADKIDSELKAFQAAKILDLYTNEEATKRLRPLEALCDKQAAGRDKVVDDMIARQDFVGIGKYLNPLRDSKYVIKREKNRQYLRRISDALKAQCKISQGKKGQLTEKDAQYIADTLRALQDADKEIGSNMRSSGQWLIQFEKETGSLKSKLRQRLEYLAGKMSDGSKKDDFFVMGVNHHYAHFIAQLDESFLWTAKGAYQRAKQKCDAAMDSLPKTVDSFVTSSFANFRQLEKALSTLQHASKSEDPKLPLLQQLYKKTVSSLSKQVNDRLVRIREQVEDACCYDDGIEALKALEKALGQGLANHVTQVAPLPFDCKSVLDTWTEKRAEFYTLGTSPGDVGKRLKLLKQRMEKLKNANIIERYVLNTEHTYKRHQQELRKKVEHCFQDGVSALRQRDAMHLRTSLDMLVQFTEGIGEHVPSAAVKRGNLEDRIVQTLIEVCHKSIQQLEEKNLIEFEAAFPELRLFVINFEFILGRPAAMKEFCLVAQLVHDVVLGGINQLQVAVADHNFSETRDLIIFNRTHGGFFVDHYGLLFEELKQLGKSIESEWFQRISDIGRESFASGRRWQKIQQCAILGVVPSASESEIRKAFKQKALVVHPDKKNSAEGDSGQDFRRAKEAHDDLLSDSGMIGCAKPFDELLLKIPSLLETTVRNFLRHQDYDLLQQLLEQLQEMQMVCMLVEPELSYDKAVESIHKVVKDQIHSIRLQVDTFWTERKYKELNLCIEDLKTAEQHLKSFPRIFPESWNQGIIEKVEREIQTQGAEARLLLQDKKTARECFDDFRRCFIQMGGVLVELQLFSSFTKDVMSGVLELCLESDWGYNYLFDLGLSLHRGDDSISEDENRIGQTLLSEFSHFKEVMTMVWNEETAQKPVEDTVRDIKGLRRTSPDGTSVSLCIDKDALLHSFRQFETEYKLLLSEFLPSGSDLGKLANRTIDRANKRRPISCAGGWDSRVKGALPQILAGIFAMFTVIKSGESYNRIKESSSDENLGDNLLMKPHNIQVLTLLHLLGCGNDAENGLKNQLMQIRTGEGKSMILGAAAAALGLLGFKVRCVCYSEYLSARDWSLFESVFKRLHLERLVVYSKITTLSEDTTTRKGDIRGLTAGLLNNIPGQQHSSSRGSHPPPAQLSTASTPSPAYSSALTHQTQGSQSYHTSSQHTTNVCLADPTLQGSLNPHIAAGTFPAATASGEEILLVDEVDVFFGSDFYGQTYNQVTKLRLPEVTAILTDVWNKHNQGGRKQRLTDVQVTPAYQNLVQAMPSFQSMIDNEIRLMLDHVQRIDNETYIFDPGNDKIGYKVLDGISYQVTYGYLTVFAYLKEATKGNLRNKEETLRRELYMPVSCGQFSYANINPARILGVSGTLEAMGEFEKDVLFDYGIKDYIFVPSVYGQSNFVFDKAGDGIYIEEDKSDYFQKICDEIRDKTNRKRPVIVFFKDSTRLAEFKSSPFFSGLGRQKAILSEDMEPGSKDFVINKAATSGQVTICPAVFGRGTDFFCKDDKVQDAGGVHIIQAFLSTEKSEEVQIQGRTARQGKKGSYQMVLLEGDLKDNFGISQGEKDSIARERRYEWLHQARTRKHGQHWKLVGENLKLATGRDQATHQYFDALLAGQRESATTLFKDLYAMIKKPPIPDEIAVDIALAVDITGSMAPYSKHTRETIEGLLAGNNSIVSKLGPSFPDTTIKVRLGIIAFRDIDDRTNQFQESVWSQGGHFTESVPDVLAYLRAAALNPTGGHDLAEDILGAINRCAGWSEHSDWSSQIKMIVLFTDAPAHGFVPPCSIGQPNVDSYAVRHPRGFTPASIACALVPKGINLVVCSYNPLATALTEEKLAEEYLNHPDNSAGREIKRIPMVPQSVIGGTAGKPLLGEQPKHIVFVLDESGSMRGSWAGVVESFRRYLARRRENQNEMDLVSVVQFDSTARVTVQQTPIGSAPANLGFHGRGTQFAPAANEGSRVVASTPPSHVPTLVFMSDGGTNDARQAAATLQSLNAQVLQKHGSDLELHVIAFGNGADTEQLQQIAHSSPKGRVHLSSDTVQLSNIFATIAGGHHVATALQSEIAKEISEAVSDTLSLEYLS